MDHPEDESNSPNELTIEEPMNRLSRAASTTLTYLHLDADKMLAYLLSNAIMACHAASVMIMSFIAKEPKYSCVPKDASSNTSAFALNRCTVVDAANRTESCLHSADFHIHYPPDIVHATLGAEFNLICDDEHWASHATSIFMLGGMIIAPILTQLSDRYGRRYTFLIPLWVAVISNIVCSIAPDYTTFLVFRLIAGVGTVGFSTIGWVLCLESVSVEFRSLIPFVGTISWVLGYELVGFLRMAISSWRWLYFTISVPGLLTVSYYWLMPESLHWMVIHNKTKGISKYLKNSSRLNKKELALDQCRSSEDCEEAQLTRGPNEAAKRTLFDILKFPALLVHLLFQCFIMSVMNAVYWGLSLFSSDLSEDEMSGYLLSGFVELPAGMLAVFLLTIFGRRTVSAAALLAQASSMAAAVLYPGRNWTSMVLQLLAKVFNSICWAAQPLLLAELSPTSVRNIFYGIVGFVGEIGSIGAPYLDILKRLDERAPALVLALLSAIAGVAVLFAPETKGKILPADLNDFDAGPVWNYFFPKKAHEDIRNGEAGHSQK
ncbi:hypothetical protein QR680_005528 [Steinernema hermaphroditum]|uniref:Major facilitator superfamily (MFS) profile domain-containing protein n=1 Tax=Steinernema hermaphroditum TaxID=289476 RepID=A0AA39HTR8_9BILA|nr:hypothetical protein QR680_005528 [Steinernema hermaphroditum]